MLYLAEGYRIKDTEMDPVEKEQKFDAIRMVLSHGYLGAARSAFEALINQELIDMLDEVIKIMEDKGFHSLIEDIEKLKVK
jgi:hypothetical protein